MDTEEFRKYGKMVIDYICDYKDSIDNRNVAPVLDPGYLKKLIPDEPPPLGENFGKILQDFEIKIMPGIVHWNHPKFFAYFPSGNSYPSIIGDLLSSSLGVIGFSWASSPAATELETIVLNWYGKALGLPKQFLSGTPGSNGGGVLQGSASECTLVCMIAARERALLELQKQTNNENKSSNLHKLVAYCSKEAHSSVEKAAKIALVNLRILDADEYGCFRGETLKKAIEKDLEKNLKPFFVAATIGTTGACAFDNLNELGYICNNINNNNNIWFHVDGAYAGNSFILPEMRKFGKGLEYADSFNTNPNKLLLTNFDASAMWVKNVIELTTALNVNPLYLQHEHSSAIDYRHYGIPLSRRFRALKLWFVFRTYGIIGLQKYVRNHILLAKKFERLVKTDERFEVRNDVHVGLVCFRLRNSDEVNRELLALINHSGKLHMVPAIVRGKYAIRFCVTYEYATEKHIDDAWEEIKAHASELLRSTSESEKPKSHVKPKMIRKLTGPMSLRFSFTRSVSREVFEDHRNRANLTDACTPILVPDIDDIIESFENATKINLENLESYHDNDSTDVSN